MPWPFSNWAAGINMAAVARWWILIVPLSCSMKQRNKESRSKKRSSDLQELFVCLFVSFFLSFFLSFYMRLWLTERSWWLKDGNSQLVFSWVEVHATLCAGHPAAMNQLGLSFATGRGVAVDPAAVSWPTKMKWQSPRWSISYMDGFLITPWCNL